MNSDISLLKTPLSFIPVYKEYLWGGTRIAKLYGRKDAPEVCAESWEISSHPDGMSVVADGAFVGLSLQELIGRYGRQILGTDSPSADRFPLLIKIIDARESLSVQIHPSEADSACNPNDYKNECWHCLDLTEEARIYAGFSLGYDTRERFAEYIQGDAGKVGDTLNVLKPQIGETLFIPSGLVHAIGAGSLVYEVQQNSNKTFRFYDWGRVGKDGKARELHFQEALRSIDWRLSAPSFCAPTPMSEMPLSLVLKTPYFTIRELTAERGKVSLQTGGRSFHALFVKEGKAVLQTEVYGKEFGKGESVFLPAVAGRYSLETTGAVLITTL